VDALWLLASASRHCEDDRNCEGVDRDADDPHKPGPAWPRQGVNPTKDKRADDRRQTDEAGDDALGKPQSEILIPLTEFKVHAAEVANKVAAAALTVTGGYGYRRGPIERAFRDARAAIAMGPSNVIARDWIGKSLVGLPLELFYEGGE
jgi:alkylation response protein AidB-like acyl-CoA dehydrogenase